MQPKQHISPSQAASFIYFAINAISVSVYTQTFALTGRAVGVATTVGLFVILSITWWILYLANLYPGNTILEIIETTTGKLVSRLINVVFIFLTVIPAACALNVFAGIMQTFFLPNTPPWVVMVVITTVSVMMARDGIEVLGRFGLIVLIFSLVFSLPIFGLGAVQFQIENILPVFVISPAQFTKGVYLEMGLFAEGGLLFMMIMAGALAKPKRYYKTISIGFLTFGFFRIFPHISIIALLGTERAATMPFAGINAVQSISVAGFLYGLEIILVMGGIMFVYMAVPIYFYSSWTALKQIFNNWKPDVLLGILFVAITGTAIGMNSFNTAYAVSIWLAEYVMLPFVLLVLMIASVGCWVKRRGNARKFEV